MAWTQHHRQIEYAEVVERASASLRALEPVASSLSGEIDQQMLLGPAARGFFRPQEELQLLDWWSRFLTVREGLWSVIDNVSEPLGGDLSRVTSLDEWRLFAFGYVAACALVGIDRELVEEIATDGTIQRKLNEGDLARRIPRKQFTSVWRSLTEPSQAVYLDKAMRLALDRRDEFLELADCPFVGDYVSRLEELEEPLDRSRRRYVKALAAYGEHSVLRRGASTRQQTLLTVLEWGGRLVAEVKDRWRDKRVSDEVRAELRELLRPGDVLVTRHEYALSNLFLPGYWPHAALFMGTAEQREQLGVEIDLDKAKRWSGDRCVLEALKDGVRFRPLEETANVDAIAVLRPRLSERDLAHGLSRVVEHEGKLYNFDFDFFRSDRLVCTEVVYRAYDGLGEKSIELVERAGRPTLSAEDLIDLALERSFFEPIAVFGTPDTEDRLVTGNQVADLLARSYRQSEDGSD